MKHDWTSRKSHDDATPFSSVALLHEYHMDILHASLSMTVDELMGQQDVALKTTATV